MKKYFSIILLAATLLTNHAQAADNTIKLAITGPFSGGSAPMGVSMRDGAKLAVDVINRQGGVDVGGKKMRIEVIERDDEAKNDRGALIAQELASMKGQLAGVIGTVNTGVALAGDKHLQENRIVKIITPSAGSAVMSQWRDANVSELFMFRLAAHDGIQSSMVVQEAIKRKFTKVALFHDTSNYGASGKVDLMNQIKLQGNKLEVVATEKFNIGDKDMSAQLLRAKSAGAQAILIWGVGPELAAVANDMAKINVKLPLIGGWALSMANFIGNAGKNADGALMPQTFIEPAVTPRGKAFVQAYHQAYGVTRITSPVSAAQGYDAVLIFAAALKQAGSIDGRKIKDALEDLKEPVLGVIATWNKPFSKWDAKDETTHEAFRRDQTVMGMVKDGRVVFADEADRVRLAKAAGGKRVAK